MCSEDGFKGARKDENLRKRLKNSRSPTSDSEVWPCEQDIFKFNSVSATVQRESENTSQRRCGERCRCAWEAAQFQPPAGIPEISLEHERKLGKISRTAGGGGPCEVIAAPEQNSVRPSCVAR